MPEMSTWTESPCAVMKCTHLAEKVWRGQAAGHLQDAAVCQGHHAAMTAGEPFDIDVDVDATGEVKTIVRMGDEREDGTHDLLEAQQNAPASGYRLKLTLRPHGREDLEGEAYDIRVDEATWRSLFGDSFGTPGG